MHPESRSWMQILSNHIWFEIKLTCKNNVNIRANQLNVFAAVWKIYISIFIENKCNKTRIICHVIKIFKVTQTWETFIYVTLLDNDERIQVLCLEIWVVTNQREIY